MAHADPLDQEALAMRKLALLAAIAGAIAAVLKKQRDRELDEAIWEEPRDL